MANPLREFRNHTKVFFFTMEIIFTLLGFFLTQIEGLGERRFVHFWPTMGIEVTVTHALGYLFIGIGLFSWTAVVVAFIVPSEER